MTLRCCSFSGTQNLCYEAVETNYLQANNGPEPWSGQMNLPNLMQAERYTRGPARLQGQVSRAQAAEATP